MNKLYNKTELIQMQKDGMWPTSPSDLLETKYADRYEMAKRLHDKLSTEEFVYLESVKDRDPPHIRIEREDNLADKNWVIHHGGNIIGYDHDVMLGPIDWYKEHDDTLVGDIVRRRKVYVFQWAKDAYEYKKEQTGYSFPELEYFIEMQHDFQPVLEHYYNECFSDLHSSHTRVLYKLMIINYDNPTATEDNFLEHRKHNTERFGASHCDETLGGLHLGENYQEFEALNVKTDAWEKIPGLTENDCLWMFSEHAEEAGWKPTYHRMVHNPDPNLKTRYSIIFDLQARKIGEN